MDYCQVLNCKTDGNIPVRAQLFLGNLSAAFKSATTSSFSEQIVIILAVSVSSGIFYLVFVLSFNSCDP